MSKTKTEIKVASELLPEIAYSIGRATEREFGNDPLVYASPELYVLGFLEGVLAARVGILQRTITVEHIPLRIGGICSVVTEPEYRCRGIAYRLMGEAVSYLKDELRLPFGLLTCKPRLETFYTRLGWQTVASPTVFAQADGVRSCGGLTMIIECDGKHWPDGKVDLCGLPW